MFKKLASFIWDFLEGEDLSKMFKKGSKRKKKSTNSLKEDDVYNTDKKFLLGVIIPVGTKVTVEELMYTCSAVPTSTEERMRYYEEHLCNDASNIENFKIVKEAFEKRLLLGVLVLKSNSRDTLEILPGCRSIIFKLSPTFKIIENGKKVTKYLCGTGTIQNHKLVD